MGYQQYLFDLDGTLTDPGVGIKNSIRYALERFGLPGLEEAVLERFIGPPLLDSFARYCGATPEESRRLLQLYREYFSERGIFENQVYDGIPETLAALRQRGARLYLATSKPELYARQILEHFGLAEQFAFIGGSTMDETRTDKAEVIRYVMESAGIPRGGSVMVGDRVYDIRGGKTCGIATVGVLYGYGDRQELSEADRLIQTPEELLTL
ncbi:MAG: HAD family hydrolase [Clostridia bacterium]|nr:HAD family hydrolase [Clostridia bacterium]